MGHAVVHHTLFATWEVTVDHVDELTLEEKALLVLGGDFWHTATNERVGIGPITVADGPHGLRLQPEEADHAGIGGSVPATCFPTASALASSWDRSLVGEVGSAIAQEARVQGVSVVLGPGINIKRSPLCGRNFEYLSEDPFLAGELATAMVTAIQAQGVGTSLKHFAANNQEDDRLRVSAEVDERTLREIYLPAFERVVTTAQPWTVMCAYNKVNGTYASEHHWLLTQVLREEWGFEGLVMSDWGAVHDRVAALAAGLDLEMPPAIGRSDVAVVDAVRSGALPEAVLDTGVRRVLRLVDQAQPVLQAGPPAEEYDEHHALARRAAAASMVLLRNEGEVLPLAAGTSVAVVGAFAARPRFQGAGSSQVEPTRVDVPLEELRAALGGDVPFAPGFELADPTASTASGSEEHLVAEAVALARSTQVTVLFLGLPDAAESEGFDRTDVDLPANQVALLEAVARAASEAAGRVVVVLANGSVVRTSPWEHLTDAVVECWLGGQAAGGGLADVLTGAVNPSGKLAETVLLRLQDSPSYLTFPGDSQVVRYGEGVFVGYRGLDAADVEVGHPFGFGLSYTTFSLGSPASSVTGSVVDGDLAVTVRVPVTNAGAVAGAEVVQVYVAAPDASVTRPPRELKGFERVHLDPGETREVLIELDQRAFSYWSVRLGRWVVEAGDFVVHVGTSSRDLPHALTVSLDAPSVAPPLDAGSTLHEWLADPRGRELLGDHGVEPGLLQVIGTMPVETLAVFGMGGLTPERLAELLAGLQR